MLRGLLKNVSKVFSFGSGNQDAFGSANARKSYGYWRSPGDLYVPRADPTMIFIMTKACGSLLLYLMAQVTSKKKKTMATSKESVNGLKGDVDDSRYVLKDEGYQSASTSKQFEKELLKLEEYYRQQSGDLDSQPKLQHEPIEKKVYVSEVISFDEYDDIDDDDYNEEYTKRKGKGGKRYVKKTCHLEEEQQHLKLKEQYLSKIKNKKRCLRFQRLDNETQLMICKIDALRESGGDKTFFDKLLRMVEGKSLEVKKLKKIVEKMKELEDSNAKTIEDIIDEHQRMLFQKDQEIKHLKKKLEAKKRMKDRLIKKTEKRFEKHLKTENLNEEYQTIIANMEALRKSDSVVYNEVLNMLGELENFK